MKISKPEPGTYPEYYHQYISKVKSDNILEDLLTEHYDTIDLITSFDEETLQFRYAPGKWTIREIVQHLIDCERIFCYRALRFARNDKKELAGFDEDFYVENSTAVFRDINDMARELSVVRAATIELFKSFNEAVYDRSGVANGKEINVKALLYSILGHEIHHRGVIEERYM